MNNLTKIDYNKYLRGRAEDAYTSEKHGWHKTAAAHALEGYLIWKERRLGK